MVTEVCEFHCLRYPDLHVLVVYSFGVFFLIYNHCVMVVLVKDVLHWPKFDTLFSFTGCILSLMPENMSSDTHILFYFR